MLTEASERTYADWLVPSIRAARLAGQRLARARIVAGEGFLYVGEIIGTDFVKIGFSLRPERRMRTLGLRDGMRVRLLTVTPGTLKQERALHRELRPHQLAYSFAISAEYYPASILTHPALPAGLRTTQPRRQPKRVTA